MPKKVSLAEAILAQVKAGKTVTFSPNMAFTNMVEISVLGVDAAQAVCPDAALLAPGLEAATGGK